MLLTAEQNFDLGTRNGIWITYAKSSTKWKKLITFSKDMAVVIYNTPVRDCLNRSELRNSVKDSPSLTVRTVFVDVNKATLKRRTPQRGGEASGWLGHTL